MFQGLRLFPHLRQFRTLEYVCTSKYICSYKVTKQYKVWIIRNDGLTYEVARSVKVTHSSKG